MYLYHAHAVALGGIVERPTQQIIPALASCSLALSGGTSSAKESNFDNGLVAFASAQSDITGSAEARNGATVYVTGVNIAINGLNIRNMVMADQVVLRLASEHQEPSPPGTPWGEPKIITTGCHFDNLKIAGHSVDVVTDHQFFSDFPSHGDLETAWSGAARARVENRLMGSTINSAPGPTDPGHLHDVYNGCQNQKALSTLKPTVLCSFVQKVDGIDGTEITNWGPIIRIPQFGTLYLGEVISCPGHRRVNMFRLLLGSPDAAGLNGGSGGSNGTGYP